MIKRKDKLGEYAILCDECPIAREEIEERRERLSEYDDFQPEYCGCAKIGGDEFMYYGFCEDGIMCEEPAEKKSKRVRENRWEINRKKKLRKWKLAEGKYHKIFGAYVEHGYVDGKWVPVGKHVKLPSKSNNQRYLKRRNNKAVRRSKSIPGGKASYKKVMEYAWELS